MTSKLSTQTANSPWPCLQQNPKHTGQSPYIGPLNPTLAWKLKPDNGINGSPVIGTEGTIFVPGTDNCIYAISPESIVKWKYNMQDNEGLSASNFECEVTPTIDINGTVYLGLSVIDVWNPINGYFYAMHQDGTLKWSIPLAGIKITNCVIGSDGTIYVGSYDDAQGIKRGIHKLHAIYPSGGQKWEMDAVGPLGSPAIGTDGTIYIAAGSGAFGPYSAAFYAVRPDGSLKWRNDNCGGIGNYLYGPDTFPVILPNGLVLIANDQKLLAVDQNGEIKWSFGIGQYRSRMDSNPAVSPDGTIYFIMKVGNDSLFALNSDGTRKWAAYAGDYSSPPVIDANNDIWIGLNNGKIVKYNSSGELKWSGYSTSGYINEMSLDALGTLYFSSSDKNIYAYFSPDSSLVPDVHVSEISFYPIDGINVGTQTKVHVEITELSGKGPTRCHVTAYHTGINTDNIIGSAYAFVPGGSKGHAEIVWNTQTALQPGEYTIIAAIDETNPPEGNTANNQFQTTYKLLKSIQNQMSAGSDTIWVEPGTYTENITMSGNKVVKSILGPQRTIINGNGAANVVQFNYLDSTAVLDGFTIIGGGRGVSFERGGGIVRNCIIKMNQTGIWSIGSMVYTDPIIENNIITENSQYAMDTNNSWALLNNNTIVNNSAGVKGYGFYSPSPTIVNCILWNNNDDLVETGSAIYSCIQNGDPGTGNISSDPLFVDPEHEDYHLQQGSPCINAGHPDPSFNDPDGSRADMGAFYYSSGTSVHSQEESALPHNYHLGQNYPNPFNPVTTIEYQLPKDTYVTLRIFNITGELVKTIKNERQSAGYYKIQWNGRDENGKSIAGGLYLYHLKADGFSQSNKMILIR
jgi:hypothetical protein